MSERNRCTPLCLAKGCQVYMTEYWFAVNEEGNEMKNTTFVYV